MMCFVDDTQIHTLVFEYLVIMLRFTGLYSTQALGLHD